MILGYSEILKALESGEIRIDPFNRAAVGPASIDLHVHNAFRIFKGRREIIDVTDEIEPKRYTEGIWIPDSEHLLLLPGETALGITCEKITLPKTICGWLEGRSKFARIGLFVHVSASFMQPGITNHQVLELSNVGPAPLKIYPGIAVCQFIFERVEGEGVYQGMFKEQTPETFYKD